MLAAVQVCCCRILETEGSTQAFARGLPRSTSLSSKRSLPRGVEGRKVAKDSLVEMTE